MQRKKRSTTVEINFISTYPGYFLESLAFFAFALLGISLSFGGGNTSDSISILGTVALGLQKLLRSMQQIYVAVTRINSKKSTYKAVLNALKQNTKLDVLTVEKESLSFQWQYENIHAEKLQFTLFDFILNNSELDEHKQYLGMVSIIEEFTRTKLITNTNYDFKKVPKLSETWFCCAEPSKIQLDRIKTNKALI